MEHQIKTILKEKGITQKELAERLGMSLQQLNNTVSGRNTASMAVFERIAEALGVEFWKLFAPADVAHEGYEKPADQAVITCPDCGRKINLKAE